MSTRTPCPFPHVAKSFYVRRSHPLTGRIGWTGSIRSPRQASREASAWIEAGWHAEVVPNGPETRRKVRSWQQQRRRERAAA